MVVWIEKKCNRWGLIGKIGGKGEEGGGGGRGGRGDWVAEILLRVF